MNRFYKLLSVLILAIVMLFGSCNIYNPSEPTPAYIHIDKITVTTNSETFLNSENLTEGSLSSKISDAWVYIDEKLIGCFELPATFPVLSDGTHTLKIRAGIKVNGIAATRAPYPFYLPYTQSIYLQKGVVTNVASLNVQYSSSTHFSFMEDFENVGTIISKTSNADTSIQKISSPASEVFEGTTSGIGYLDQNHYLFECESSNTYQLPRSGADVILEFNYKSNHEFVVGIIANTMSGSTVTNSEKISALNFNASPSWNKAYLYLTPAINQSGSASKYKIFLGMVNSNGENGLTLSLDNIKLVYF